MKKGKLYQYSSSNKGCDESVWICTKDVSKKSMLYGRGQHSPKYRQSYLLISGSDNCVRCCRVNKGCNRIGYFNIYPNKSNKVEEL